MSNYEGKLGEWLKYVQQQIESPDTEETEEEKAKAQKQSEMAESPQSNSEHVVMRDRMGHVVPDDVDEIDTQSVAADTSIVDRGSYRDGTDPTLFDDSDVPEVEDYLPFLKEPVEQRPLPTKPEPIPEPLPRPEPVAETPLVFEGTGEPKPVFNAPVDEKPKRVQPRGKATPTSKARVQDQVPPSDLQAMWDKLPRHIQLLFGEAPKEIAQHSYKIFKESREELVARLLDPTLSLEEAARILNVCPTTVRRYTNRDVLRHYRTAGNQRRFRLSDVLAFLESHK
jgi:excisionase family DNA binding protein